MTNAAANLSKPAILKLFPDIVRRYTLQGNDPIGAESGFGAVWKAHDNWLGQEIALKISKINMCDEVQLCRDIEGQTIRIFDYFRSSDNWNAYTMELLEKPWISLRQFIEKHKYKSHDLQHYFDAFEIMRSILNGLKHIHGRAYSRKKRYIHADIKPDNLFLLCRPKKRVRSVFRMPPTESLIKIIDLGVSIPKGKTLKGSTYNYSPHTNKARPGVDLYAVGVSFLELLTGICPGSEIMVSAKKTSDFIAAKSSGSAYIDNVAVKFSRMCAKAANQNSVSAGSCMQLLDDDIFSLNDIDLLAVREMNKNLPIGRKKEDLSQFLFDSVANYNDWKNKSAVRTDSIKELIKNLYDKELLILKGHYYFIR